MKNEGRCHIKMRVLFLTLLDFNTFEARTIYTDLLREMIKHGHDVYCISPVERRTGIATHFEEDGHILKLRIGNTQKTNIVEKGISTVMIERQFVSAINRYYSNIKFDLVLYSTPPITFANVVKYVKKRDGAKTYLLLKDIFPQNAVDLKMMKTKGVLGLIHKYFRMKEKKLYSFSDRIGCMSQANVDYVLQNNPELPKEKVEVCPNCIEVCDVILSEEERIRMRKEYGIPVDKRVYVYGGNLGKPQGIPFLIDCIRSQRNNQDAFFLIVGDGTEYEKLHNFATEENQQNFKLLKLLPKKDYDKMIASCDVGMIFLDHRFTIPNFPSRLLAYMQAGLPVLACTDPSTDIGKVIVDGGFGWWCESNDVQAFDKVVSSIDDSQLKEIGKSSLDYLNSHYTTQQAYKIVTRA